MSPPLIATLTPAAAPPPLKSLHSPPPQLLQPDVISTISRRSAAVLLTSIIAPILRPPPASAFSIGISGPKEWLKEQKKKSAKFLLAPVDASRNILQSAYLLLTKSEAEIDKDDMDEVQKLLVAAARDCVPQDRNNFVEFQANTGVEVCTFRLIVKNASSLLDESDPLKLEAESKLDDLIRSFSSLSGMAKEGGVQFTLNRQRVADALKDTVSSLNNFEQGIKDCLQVSSLRLTDKMLLHCTEKGGLLFSMIYGVTCHHLVIHSDSTGKVNFDSSLKKLQVEARILLKKKEEQNTLHNS